VDKGVCIAKVNEGTYAGTWIIGLEDNAEMTFEGEDKFIATPVNDGKIMVRQEGDSSQAVFEKSKSTSSKKAYKAFMGTWKGTYEGEPVELSFFMVKNIVIWKIPGETIAGMWTIDHEGNVWFTIVVQYEGDSEAALLEKIDSKKK